ncbi:MAG: amidohydrolase [Deltaproteobacteria bacterium]|nr:MAG: amidohydrolase [Deltaproteobacteria bacterium]
MLTPRSWMLLAVFVPLFARAQPAPPGDIDPELARLLATAPAIDNHAHPVLPPPNLASDRGFDALPVDSMEPQTDPVAWRPDNPQLSDAWKALWHFTEAPPLSPEAMKRLGAARDKIRAQQGERYDQWVLDQAHIATMLGNRVAMGPGVAPPRFRWVPYIDALVFPLDNSGLAAATPDRAQFFPLEDKLRAQYLQSVHLQAPPATLDAYLTQVVTPILERHQREGAVAEKFEIAYLRGFDFSDPPRETAARVYAAWHNRAHPDLGDYKVLQDFLFRYIAAECGRLHMAVHLHSMSGAGGYFGIAAGNPLLLEPLFNASRLRSTKFVLLHGGWPFVHEVGALLQKPNVWLDLSQQSLVIPPRTLAGWLREWLEIFPDKVLFATDGYPFSDALGWEEAAFLASRNIRQALGIALTGMLRDREISRERATAIARGVLHDNAAQLYSIP